jgi:hypothetical protein
MATWGAGRWHGSRGAEQHSIALHPALPPCTLVTHLLSSVFFPATLSACLQVNAGFFYSSAEQREKLVAAERAVTDEKVQRVIELKKKVRLQL